MKTGRLMAVLALGFLSCTANNTEEPSVPPVSSDNNGKNDGATYSALISKTQPYPSSYTEETTHRGRIERIDYDTHDYAEGTGRTRTNTAYVYQYD